MTRTHLHNLLDDLHYAPLTLAAVAFACVLLAGAAVVGASFPTRAGGPR